ncbi:hypothetical protein ACE6H2_010121 [Prunus campanulata]
MNFQSVVIRNRRGKKWHMLLEEVDRDKHKHTADNAEAHKGMARIGGFCIAVISAW